MSRHGGSGGAETGGDTRFRGEQDRFTRPSIKKKLAQKRAEESNPRNATQLWNRSTKPFDASVRVAITRNKTETGPSFLLLLLLPSLFLSPFNRSFLFFSPLSTRVPLPRHSPANKTVSKICVRKYALKRDEFPPSSRSKGESRDRNFNARVPRTHRRARRVHAHETRQKTAGYASSILVDRIIRAVFLSRSNSIKSNGTRARLLSSVLENIIEERRRGGSSEYIKKSGIRTQILCKNIMERIYIGSSGIRRSIPFFPSFKYQKGIDEASPLSNDWFHRGNTIYQ